jgi:DNA polymerase-1
MGHLETFKQIYATLKLEISINHIPSGGFEKEILSLDIEHDESGEFVGCGIHVPSTHRIYYYSDIHTLSRLNLSTLAIVAHNGKTDIELLQSWGLPVRQDQLVWDTYLMAHIQDSSKTDYGLKSLAKEYGIEYPTYDDIVGKKTKKQSKERITLDKQPEELTGRYCGMDCFTTSVIYLDQRRKSTEAERNYFTSIEKPVSFIFQKMSNRGCIVNLAYLQELKKTLEEQREPLKKDIVNELGGINLNSPKQLLEALHAKEIYPVLKKKASTDQRALASFAHLPIVQSLLSYGKIETLLSSFVEKYIERGEDVVHPFFNQCGTRTGRLSCSNPNLLQIPKRGENGKLVRGMFVPREGMRMGDCDYGQIEPRVLAHLSKDQNMLRMFNENIDFHSFTADKLEITRDAGKVLNLSVGYRATSKSVSAQLKCTEQEAQYEINKWWSLFPGLRRWQDSIIWASKKSGYCTTLLGRRIKVDGLAGNDPWARQAAERQLINNITQGSAAEIMKLAMLGIDKCESLSNSFGLLVQVYDELLFESREIEADMAHVVSCMEKAIKLDVPLVVDAHIGSNWAEAH